MRGQMWVPTAGGSTCGPGRDGPILFPSRSGRDGPRSRRAAAEQEVPLGRVGRERSPVCWGSCRPDVPLLPQERISIQMNT